MRKIVNFYLYKIRAVRAFICFLKKEEIVAFEQLWRMTVHPFIQ